MVANWLLSKKCDPIELGEKLKCAPFDCIVVVMSAAVAESDPISKYFSDLAQGNLDKSDLLADVLREKAVYRLFGQVFVALHRAKIVSCHYAVWSARSRGESALDFGALELVMDNSRQRMDRIKIGILDVRCDGIWDSEVEALVEWVVMDRIALLTGNFPKCQKFVSRLATEANAIHHVPLFQGVKYWDRSRGEWQLVSATNYFLLFGYYRSIKTASEPFIVMPSDWSIGQDIWEDMIVMEDMPSWLENDEGSVFVPNLGNVKMKNVDFTRWCRFSIQTCLWLGTATPSYKSQNRSRGKASKGKDKGQGKEKNKGKGKGTSKSKTKTKAHYTGNYNYAGDRS